MFGHCASARFLVRTSFVRQEEHPLAGAWEDLLGTERPHSWEPLVGHHNREGGLGRGVGLAVGDHDWPLPSGPSACAFSSAVAFVAALLDSCATCLEGTHRPQVQGDRPRTPYWASSARGACSWAFDHRAWNP